VGILIGVGVELVRRRRGRGGVPFLTWCSMSIHRAIGRFAAMGFRSRSPAPWATSSPGLGVAGLPAWSAGFVYLPAFAGFAAASMLVAPFGARLAHRLKGSTLRRIFAVFLVAVGIKIAISV